MSARRILLTMWGLVELGALERDGWEAVGGK
jgi:hypothetical protein